MDVSGKMTTFKLISAINATCNFLETFTLGLLVINCEDLILQWHAEMPVFLSVRENRDIFGTYVPIGRCTYLPNGRYSTVW